MEKKAQVLVSVNKLIRIKDIAVDEKLYPRSHVNFQTQSRYYNAIQAGANLPPITVATKVGEKSRKYTLVDGRHRIEAMKGLGEEVIQAEVFENLTNKEIFTKAIQMNTIHGKPFDASEVVAQCQRMRDDFKMTLEEISSIVRIPIDKIEPFVAKRITRIIETGEPVVLKKSLYEYAGVEISQDSMLPQEQRKLDGLTQIRMIDGVITLVKGNYVSKMDESVEHALKRLYKLLKTRYEDEDNINKVGKRK